MKLNPDCVRDVLLYLEENLCYTHNKPNSLEHQVITIQTISQYLNNNYGYDIDDVSYSIEKLVEIKFIVVQNEIKGTSGKTINYSISDITWNGHQFLNTIRPKNIWEATKVGASKLGIMSMHALSAISMKVAEAVVTNPVVISKIVETIL